MWKNCWRRGTGTGSSSRKNTAPPTPNNIFFLFRFDKHLIHAENKAGNTFLKFALLRHEKGRYFKKP
jgi:hypothetical protein